MYDLEFELEALERFQKEPIGSYAFNLRLIELVVIACHQGRAGAYAVDQGTYKHKLYQDWRDKVLEEKKHEIHSPYEPPVAAFSHRAYQHPEQYPRGIADVAGYWTESKIFGGVALFDRGEAEDGVSFSRYPSYNERCLTQLFC
ncbi:unnamed protein product [Fusarium langsethiae]|nr:unnamed protein product [Fusarium langsethiae]